MLIINMYQIIKSSFSKPVRVTMKKVSKEIQIKRSEDYVEFLIKRLNSNNYKLSVTKEEYAITKTKLDKERLILKLLK